MGNKYKLRLSDMISSGSWIINKLRLKRQKRNKSHSTRTTTELASPDTNPRKSYHFGRELNSDQANSPRKKTLRLNKNKNSPSLSSSVSSATTPRRRPSTEFRFDRVLTPDLIDKTNSSSSSSSSYAAGEMAFGAVNLTPIATKKKNKTVIGTSKGLNSPGVRLRMHSPRLLASARRIHSKRGTVVRTMRNDLESNAKCGGFAVVKSSLDPWKDFRESMVEMIVENGIKDSEHLEELLACYLSLNTEEYHEVIVAVFKQIWCDLTDITFG